MAQEKLTLAQRYEMAQSELQQLASIITRIDERVEIFMKNHEKLDTKLAEHIEFCPAKKQILAWAEKMAILEGKVKQGNTALNLVKDNADNALAMAKEQTDKDIDAIGSEVEAIYSDIEKVKDKQKELELAFKEISVHSKSHDGLWKIVGNVVFQAAMSLLWVLIAIALYHFGIPAPPTKP